MKPGEAQAPCTFRCIRQRLGSSSLRWRPSRSRRLRWLWTVLSLTLVAGAVWLLLRACPRLAGDPVTLGWLVASGPVLQQLLLVGQVSALWLMSVAVSLWAFRTARPVVAGVALGLLGLKPSLLPFAIVVPAGAGQWRALAGMTLSLAGQAAIVWIGCGPAAWAGYADVVADLVGHP